MRPKKAQGKAHETAEQSVEAFNMDIGERWDLSFLQGIATC